MRGCVCMKPTSLRGIDRTYWSAWDRYAHWIRNVPQAQVKILVFTREHASYLSQDTAHKLGGREHRDASRRSRTFGMVLAVREKVEDGKRSIWPEASSGSSARESECVSQASRNLGWRGVSEVCVRARPDCRHLFVSLRILRFVRPARLHACP
jgi:hypothetical protein